MWRSLLVDHRSSMIGQLGNIDYATACAKAVDVAVNKVASAFFAVWRDRSPAHGDRRERRIESGEYRAGWYDRRNLGPSLSSSDWTDERRTSRADVADAIVRLQRRAAARTKDDHIYTSSASQMGRQKIAAAVGVVVRASYCSRSTRAYREITLRRAASRVEDGGENKAEEWLRTKKPKTKPQSSCILSNAVVKPFYQLHCDYCASNDYIVRHALFNYQFVRPST